MIFPIKKNSMFSLENSVIDNLIKKSSDIGFQEQDPLINKVFDSQNHDFFIDKEKVRTIIHNIWNLKQVSIKSIKEIISEIEQNAYLEIKNKTFIIPENLLLKIENLNDYISNINSLFYEIREFQNKYPRDQELIEMESLSDFSDEVLGIDFESLEDISIILETVSENGELTKNSIYENPDDISVEYFLQALSAFIQMPSSHIEEIQNNSVGANKELLETLLEGTNEDRRNILKKYGITLEEFQKMLIDKKFSYHIPEDGELLDNDAMYNAIFKFVQKSTKDYKDKKVKMDVDSEYTGSLEFVQKMFLERNEYNKKNKNKNGIPLLDLDNVEFYIDYFNPTENNLSQTVSTNFRNLVSDISFDIGKETSVVKNLMNPVQQDVISDSDSISGLFSRISDTKKEKETNKIKQIEDFKKTISNITEENLRIKFKDNIPKPLLDMARKKQEELRQMKLELSMIQGEKEGITSLFKKIKPSLLPNTAKIDDIYNLIKLKKDVGSLGSFFKELVIFYNSNTEKDYDLGNELVQCQIDLINSPWFRFVSPVYNLIQNGKTFNSLLSRRVTFDAESTGISSEIIELSDMYQKLLRSTNFSESRSILGKIIVLSDEFYNTCTTYLTTDGGLSPLFKSLVKINQNIYLMKINLNNPESVLMHRKKKNRPVLSSSDFKLFQTYKVKKNG